MKLALAFLAALALTQAKMDINTIPPYLNHPFSTLFRPVASGSFRIIGGQEVAPHSLPYQVLLRIILDNVETFCGGSIVSSTTVLTAAHCAELSGKIFAVFGKHVRDSSGTQLRADKIIIHPAYYRPILLNDIAIIRLNTPIKFNEHINLIRLPTHADISNDFAGEKATASGWGKYSERSPDYSLVLRSVDVTIITNEECNRFWDGFIQPTQICISTTDGRSTCKGDSGGPLVVNGKQIGISSFSHKRGCAVGYPSGFTRITEYLDWIEQNSDVVIG